MDMEEQYGGSLEFNVVTIQFSNVICSINQTFYARHLSNFWSLILLKILLSFLRELALFTLHLSVSLALQLDFLSWQNPNIQDVSVLNQLICDAKTEHAKFNFSNGIQLVSGLLSSHMQVSLKTKFYLRNLGL